MAATGYSIELRQARSVFLRSRSDVWLVAVALVHAAVIAAIAVLDLRGPIAIAFVAFGTVYVSNTVAHCHLHAPIFTSRALSRTLSLLLSLSLFIPQTAWKQRHLWHHAGEPNGRRVFRLTRALAVELVLVVAAVTMLLALRPYVVAFAIAPGFALGMCLCRLQGRFEHEGDSDIATSGVSTYAKLYNLFWFNDGFHAEHHRRPSAHWTELPRYRQPPPITSAHAPLLRGLCIPSMLCVLEKLVLRSRLLERWIVHVHTRAFAALLPCDARRVLIVGGGLFPRTALIVRKLLPHATIVIVDASRASLETARRALAERQVPLPAMVHASFDPEMHSGFDVVVFPLAFVGDRALVAQARKHNHVVLSHAWLTRRALRSSVISFFLFKRLVVE